MAKHLSQEDLTSVPLLGLVLEPLAAAPSSPKQGRVYFDTVLGDSYINVGTSGSPVWAPLGLIAGVVTNTMLAGSIANSKLATNPLDRANHTGTQTASTISDLIAVVEALRLDQFAAPTSDVSLGSHKLTNVADPGSSQDAVTLAYLTTAISNALNGRDFKESVKAVSTTNLTLSGTQTVDGVALVANDRILVAGQTTGANNGIYVVAAGAWARAGDAASSAQVTPGMIVPSEHGGTSNADKLWELQTGGTITLGTTSLTFNPVGGASYTAGTGITISGGTISLTTPVSAANGGTGVTSLAALKTALGVPGIFFAGIPAISAGSTADLTHSLNTAAIIVSFLPASGGSVTVDTPAVDIDWSVHDVNTIRLGPVAAAITAGDYLVTVVG